MAQGGARAGAGRKKGVATIEREKVKDYIASRIASDIKPIVDKLIDKALKGDVFAVKELFDRGFGKATQPIGGDDSMPLTITISQAAATKHGINAGTGADSQ